MFTYKIISIYIIIFLIATRGDRRSKISQTFSLLFCLSLKKKGQFVNNW